MGNIRKHGVAISQYSKFVTIVVVLLVLSRAFVEALNHSSSMHRGTIKTIESEEGEVIDCVDIYKQPAFDHPLINDLQMWPTSSSGSSSDYSQPSRIVQDWHINGDCPQGTIPIMRGSSRNYINHHLRPSHSHSHFYGKQFHYMNSSEYQNAHEYAQISQKAGIYHGAKATINVWNPKIEAGAGGEYSISHVSVLSMDIRASPPGLNFVEAGWIVSPGMFNDTRTRFFAYWTTDNSLTTGCFNLNCPGFVQTTQKFAMSSAIEPLSIYNGPSYNIAMAIYKGKQSGNWWFELQGERIGYWPSSLLPGLAHGGTYVTWGGEIINSRSAEHHTATQMGSGHFPGEGYRKASYFGKLKVIDDTETEKEPDDLEVVVTNSRCYDVHIQDNKTASYGLVFFYGGPGYSPDCP